MLAVADGVLVYVDSPAGGGSTERLAQLDADVGINDNTTPQDIANGTSALAWAVEANKVYKIEVELGVSASATSTGYDLAVTGPASPVSIFAQSFLSNTGTAETGEVVFISGGYGTIGSNANSGGATARPAFCRITFRNGANAGVLKLQAKVEAGVTGTVTFSAGSCGTAREVTA